MEYIDTLGISFDIRGWKGILSERCLLSSHGHYQYMNLFPKAVGIESEKSVMVGILQNPLLCVRRSLNKFKMHFAE